MRRNPKIVIPLILILASLQLHAAIKPSQPDAGRLELMLKKLTVVGKVLYIGAHPDDENTAALSYFSWGKLLRAAYLSLNRGEGGQNLIGPEQGALLGVIRTQELLGARSVDHAEQFFTRAVDFGFSKSPDESFQKWGGKDAVLSDVVWVIRKFRPDVIVTRFPKEGGGHGHHTASAILAEEAFTAAADPSRYPEQLRYVTVWQPKRLVWNRYSWGGQQMTDAEKQTLPHLDFGEYSSQLGKSYSELAGLARDNHKSQGFGDSEDRGSYLEYFRNSAGDPATHDLFEGIDFSWKRIPEGAPIGTILRNAYQNFDANDPTKSLPDLLKAYALMQKHAENPWIAEKIDEVKEAIQACSGLWLEAIADDFSVVPGGQVKVKLTAINRSHFPLKLAPNTTLPFNEPVTQEQSLSVPENTNYSQPYWLESDPDKPFADVKDQQMIGLPDSAPLQTNFHLLAGNEEIVFKVPVLYRWVDSVQGERYRKVVVVPQAAVNLKQSVLMFPDLNGKAITLEVRSEMPNVSGQLQLKVPAGWTFQPASIPFQFTKKNETQRFSFRISPGASAASGVFSAEAIVGSKTIGRGMITIDYPHIAPQVLFPRASGKLVRIDLKRTGQNIGYIVGSGDQMPEALNQIGYRVNFLSDEDLANTDLSRFDTIVIGIRAYNTRPSLKNYQSRLMDYVKQGGTLVAQYNTLQDLSVENPGPYPFHISRDRVSVEEAPVTFLKADHLLLNTPNKITQADFNGWIQERGLYFPDQWDSHYETVIACNDPGETPKPGGILYARYGKGVYIYTGYSWFRELPAGVPGAYRLFVNLLSARGSS